MHYIQKGEQEKTEREKWETGSVQHIYKWKRKGMAAELKIKIALIKLDNDVFIFTMISSWVLFPRDHTESHNSLRALVKLQCFLSNIYLDGWDQEYVSYKCVLKMCRFTMCLNHVNRKWMDWKPIVLTLFVFFIVTWLQLRGQNNRTEQKSMTYTCMWVQSGSKPIACLLVVEPARMGTFD